MYSLDETNYQLVYYFSDGCAAVSCLLVIIFLKINVEKTKHTLFGAFKRIANPATGVFLLIMLTLGFGFAIMTYLLVYLQEEMQASSAMIGRYFLKIETLCT